MKQYLDLVTDVLENGKPPEGGFRSDRTGVGTYSVFGRQLRFNLDQGFPLVTTKKVHLKSVIHELLWILSGDTNTKYLNDNGVSIWDEWADGQGELGPIYGKQWRRWQGPSGSTVDQISNLINGIRKDPYSRRHLV
ncbi:MAG: thymidylate synthase, partial [Proteobacteria bacterium]